MMMDFLDMKYVPLLILLITLVISYVYRREHFEDVNDALVSHNLLLYKGMNDVSNSLRSELDRTRMIDTDITKVTRDNTNRLNSVMNSEKMRVGVDTNIAKGRDHVDTIFSETSVNPMALNNFYITPERLREDSLYGENAIRTAIIQMVNTRLANMNMNASLADRQRLYAIVYDRYVKQMDSSSTNVNSHLYRMATSGSDLVKNPSALENIIGGAIREKYGDDKKADATLYRFRVGDFVFFRHKVDLTNLTMHICADDDKTNDLIVGGSICRIDNVNRTVKLAYSFVMNPNYNPKCMGTATSSGKAVDYKNVFPHWYAQCSTGACAGKAVCGTSDYIVKTFPNLACDASHTVLNSSDLDNWVRVYIGGLNSGSAGRSYQCGVSPTAYNLPADVAFDRLCMTVEECLRNIQTIPREDTQRV